MNTMGVLTCDPNNGRGHPLDISTPLLCRQVEGRPCHLSAIGMSVVSFE